MIRFHDCIATSVFLCTLNHWLKTRMCCYKCLGHNVILGTMWTVSSWSQGAGSRETLTRTKLWWLLGQLGQSISKTTGLVWCSWHAISTYQTFSKDEQSVNQQQGHGCSRFTDEQCERRLSCPVQFHRKPIAVSEKSNADYARKESEHTVHPSLLHMGLHCRAHAKCTGWTSLIRGGPVTPCAVTACEVRPILNRSTNHLWAPENRGNKSKYIWT